MDSGSQDLAAIRDTLPRLWWNLYQGCIVAGFNSQQSLALVNTWILGQNPHGIQPGNPAGPKSDLDQ